MTEKRVIKLSSLPETQVPLCVKSEFKSNPDSANISSFDLNSISATKGAGHTGCGEDPHKHLKEFHVVCSTMRPQRIPKDYIKMTAFPFSLDGATKD
ncbi:hypothetical protein CR513_11713, partial [Mucuna pruriens]